MIRILLFSITLFISNPALLFAYSFTDNEPNVSLKGNGTTIIPGDNTPITTDHTDFGSQLISSGTVIRTFTVENTGSATLIIYNITSTGTNSGEFVISNAPSSVPASGSTTFDVTFDPAATGNRSATITINTNDSDQPVYNFTVRGNGIIEASSLNFDGSDDYVSVPLPDIFSNIGSNDISIQAWVFPTSSSGTTSRILHAQKNLSNFVSILMNASNRVYLYIYANGTLHSIATDFGIPANEWSHITCTWTSGTNTPEIFINGVLQTTSSGGSSSIGVDNVMSIGSRSDGAQNFKGNIDEVRVWSKVLSNCEVLGYMNCEIPLSNPYIEAKYHFNQGLADENNSGVTTLIDSGNDSWNGTLMNFNLSGTTSNWVGAGGVVSGVTCNSLTSGIANSTEDMTWTGAASTAWDQVCNWSPIGVPTATNNVIIPSTTLNKPVISIGTAIAKSVEIQSGAVLDISSSGKLTLNASKTYTESVYSSSSSALRNEGTVNVYGELTLGNLSNVGQHGIWNKSVFNNHPNAELKIDSSLVQSIFNEGTFTNEARIIIGSSTYAGFYGITNNSIFDNIGTGEIIIDSVQTRGIQNNRNKTFTNSAKIFIGQNHSTGASGIYNQGEFANNSGGEIIIDQTQNIAFNNVRGIFTNTGLLSIESNIVPGSEAFRNSDSVLNNSCGQILSAKGSLINSANKTFTNEGYTLINGSLQNEGTFTNNGVLKYDNLSGSGTFTNTSSSSVVVKDDPRPIFIYGGTYNGTVDGIFTDPTASDSAGTFTAPNTFVPSGLPEGSQTLYAKISPEGGACSFIVPFSFLNCSSSATIAYSDPAFCSTSDVQSVTLSGTPGGSFSSAPAGLSINASTGEINPASSSTGIYTVTYTLAAEGECPSFEATTSVTITPSTSAIISYSGSPFCSIAEAQSVTLTGTAGGSFSSSPAGLSINASTGEINPVSSTAGVYTVTYTIDAAGGCSSVTATTSVTVTPTENADFIYSSLSYCQNVADPIPVISGVSGGTFNAVPAGLSLDAASGAIDVSASTPGSYTISYNTSGFCPGFSTFQLDINDLPVPSISGSSNLTCSVTSVTRTASGGTSYSWSGPNSFSANTAIATITAPGTYTVTVSAANGCSAQTTTVVTQDNSAPTPSVSGSANLTCSVTSVTRTASGGTSYSWSGPNSFSANTAIATISAPGTYTVTVSNSNGCSAQTTTVVTQDNSAPTPSVSGSDNLTCSVTSVTRTASGGTSYSWSGPNSFSASTAIANINAPGTYTVTVSNSNGCSAQTTTVVTQDNSAPTPSVSGSDNLTCSVTSVTRTAFGGTSYSWSGPNSFSANTAIATISAPGTYTVTVSAANGCSAQTTTVVTQDNSAPTPSVSGSDNLTCSVTSVTRTASGGTSYSWSGPNSFSANTAIATISAPGTYTVTVSAANGCSAQTTTVVTQDNSAPTPLVSGSDNLTCSVTSVTRTASGGTSYSWSGPNSFSANTAIATISAPGTYTVTVSNSNGCSAQTTTVVTQDNSAPTPSVSGSDNLTCSVTSVTRTASGGTSYSWSGPNSFSANTALATITAPGTYTVTVSAANGCSAQTTTVVTQDNSAPTPSVSGLDNLTCSVTSVTRTASGGTSYSWSGPNSFSANTAIATITAPGTYTVTVSAANGCSAQTTTVVTQDNSAPTPSVSGSDNLTCSVTSVTRTASGGTSYSWSGPGSFSANTAVVSLTTPGTYSVTVTAANGCSATSSTEVLLESTNPSLTYQSFTHPSACNFSDGTLTFGTDLPDGSFSFRYQKNGSTLTTSVSVSSGSFLLSNLEEATYTGFVIINGTCEGDDNNSVDLIAPTLLVSASNSGPYEESSTIHLVASGGTSFTWTGPNGFFSTLPNPSVRAAKPENAGIYTVTVSNGLCTATATTSVAIDCNNPHMSYYLAYSGAQPEIIAPISQNMQVKYSPSRPMTVIAVTSCEVPRIESVKLQLSGTSNVHYYEDNEMPFALHEVGQVMNGDILIPNLYTFIGRGYSMDNVQGTVLVGPDVVQFWIVNNNNTIAAPSIPAGPLCNDASFTVSTSATGEFGPGNVFQAYLSDENGDFSNPVVLGTSADPAHISCTLPNFLRGGTGYKVKVVSTATVVSSEPSVASLEIIMPDLQLRSPNQDLANSTASQKAGNTIRASNKINGSSNVSYTSGRYQTLEPGFEVQAGAVFKASVESVCPN